MAYPENPQDQNQEGLEQKPINPENDWISKVTEEDFEKMSPEKKQEALDTLAKELKEKYEHVGPNAEWGADDVAPERGIVKKEKGNVEIQSRDEFLDNYLEQYSKKNFEQNNSVEEGSLTKFRKENEAISNTEEFAEKEEKFKDEQLEKFVKEKYPNSQDKLETESTQEQLNENEYENKSEQTFKPEDVEYPRAENPDQLTEEQLAEKEKEVFEQEESIREKSGPDSSQEMFNEEMWAEAYEKIEDEEAREKIQEAWEEFLENNPTDEEKMEFLKEKLAYGEKATKEGDTKENKNESAKSSKEDGWLMKGWKAFASWVEDSVINFIFSFPSKIWDYTKFMWQWANEILDKNPKWAGKEIESRGKKKVW